jgi:hypothetical protein
MKFVAPLVTVALAGLALAAPAGATPSPDHGTLTPDANNQGKLTFSGTMVPGTAAAGTTDDCFDPDTRKPDMATGCDFFSLDVNVPSDFYDRLLGGVQATVTGFAPFDIDLGIYKRNADGSRGTRVTGSGNAPGEDERTTIGRAAGPYIVALVPYAVAPGTPYQATLEFLVKAKPDLAALNARAPLGLPNIRASHDQYISHSEPTIAMDPRNHDHLMAGSKMYENLEAYLFKIGTYESFDGGKTWSDQGHLPGYCVEAGQCDPTKEETYRTTSDIAMAFDDEGNAYGNVLDAPGGTAAFTGFNMTVHIKKPGQAWSQPITVHDNRNTPITENLLLDDKNWIAVDNNTDVNGGPNKPGDGKIGTMYVCWSFDGSQAPSQQIVIERSVDGGKTWGGFQPGDNTPYQLSSKGAISGIGCHILIGPKGEVYVTWYDNQLNALMQVKSTDRGRSFSPARPIVIINGVNEAFEGQSFRNLSIPTTGIDPKGNIYIAVASRDGEGQALAPGTSPERVKEIIAEKRLGPAENEAEGEGDKPGSGADIISFRSTDGGNSYQGPVRVNQDDPKSDADQFQPWMAVTDGGQVNVMFFDRRNDPANFFIDTYLARSNDGAKTFRDTRVSQRLWDPSINPPISVSGEFIGDYQGLVADDEVAIPFWNDTQANQLPAGDPGRSIYQEVWAARVPNTPSRAGISPAPCTRDTFAPRTAITKRVRLRARGRLRARFRRAYRVSRRAVRFVGTARDIDCRLDPILSAAERRTRGKVKRVDSSIGLRVRRGCRYLQRSGRFSRRRSCRRPLYVFRAKLRYDAKRKLTRWTFARRFRPRLRRGRYVVDFRATDPRGNRETKATKARHLTFRLR